MKKEIDYSTQWSHLSQEEKAKVAAVFNIGKSGSIEMTDNKITSDGFNMDQLSHISIGGLIQYLGDDLSYYREDLFDHLLELTFNKLLYGKEPVTKEAVVEKPAAKRTFFGRKKKD